MNLIPLLTALGALGLTSAQASLFSFYAINLNGGQEVPPNGSPGWGSATGLYDTETREFSLGGFVGGLSSGITAANIHLGVPGVAGPAVIPLEAVTGLNGGPINSPFVLLTPAEEADLFFGRWYVNIQTAEFPEGEIRGQIQLGAAVVPEPEEYAAIACLGLAGFGYWRVRVRAGRLG